MKLSVIGKRYKVGERLQIDFPCQPYSSANKVAPFAFDIAVHVILYCRFRFEIRTQSHDKPFPPFAFLQMKILLIQLVEQLFLRHSTFVRLQDIRGLFWFFRLRKLARDSYLFQRRKRIALLRCAVRLYFFCFGRFDGSFLYRNNFFLLLRTRLIWLFRMRDRDIMASVKIYFAFGKGH